ncbi:peptidase M6 [Streptomyces sp. TR06-5]|uniref:peptidase M6 n=1 Tax=unclassified Streptomyces TaxID=2593676 RepID=UPI0039A32AB2
MPAAVGHRRIPGSRGIAGATATALTAVIVALAPQPGSAAAPAVSGDCTLTASDGFSEGPTGTEFIRPTGHRTAIMIMVDFPDLPSVTPARDRASFFADYGDRYLELASYGSYRLDLEPTRGWVRMPKRWASYGIERGISSEVMRAYVQDAVDAAVAEGTDFSGTDFVYVVADDNVPAKPTVSQANTFDGLHAGGHPLRAAALVFGRGADSAIWQRGNFVHEANHLYGLPDLYNVERGASVEYAGGWDTMSMAGISDLLGWHKWKFGWIPDSRVSCVTGGTSRRTLVPVGSPDGATLAVVKTSDHSAVVAEARTRIGLDSSICTEGVLLYTVDSSVPTGRGPVRVVDTAPHSGGGRACRDRSPDELAELGDAPLQPGGSHTFADGVRVAVTGEHRGHYRVAVTAP